MTFLFVSECHPRAVPSTQRILDNYGRRASDRTWAARLSAQGIDTVRATLLREATRGTAVACYRVDGFSREKRALVWVVGNRSRFGAEGLYTRSAPSRFRKPRPQSRYVLAVVQHAGRAGLGHDLGKNTLQFKQKLKAKARTQDALRHELISLAVLAGLREGKSLEQALAECTDTAESLTLKLLSLNDPEFLTNWLIATHHRLLGANYSIDLSKHRSAEALAAMAAAGDRYTAADPELFASLLDDLVGETQAIPDIPASCSRAAAVYGRMGLMLADHTVSSLPEIAGAGEGAVLSQLRKILTEPDDAAACEAAGAKGKAKPAVPLANGWQRLAPHLRAVSAAARMATRLVCSERIPALLPALEVGQLEGLAGTTGKYAWQAAAVRHAESLTKAGGGQGILAFVAAGTGTGKTRACACLAAALGGGRARITTALGLRALTLQTGDEYRAALGLSPDQVTTLIGSRAAKDLHRIQRDEGTEGPDDEVYALAGGVPQRIPTLLEADLRSDSVYLSSPVLVTTIDQIIQAADWRRTNWLKPMLRLLSAPLVLDEIDQYDLKDLVPIGRLLFLAGLMGQSVILSSATLYPEIAIGLQAAYQAGWREHAELRGKDPQVRQMLVSDDVRLQRTGAWGADQFPFEYRAWAKNVAAAAELRAGARLSRILPAVTSREALAQQILDTARSMHVQHAQDVDGTGFQVSVGLIRFARVKDVLWACKVLAKQPSAVWGTQDMALVPYHSKLLLGWRSVLESKLDRMLKRGDQDAFTPGGYDMLPPEVRARISEAKSAGKTGLIILVVASPVEEVGRDHDFDWGLLEPSSSRSCIQAAGRIRRHRGGVPGCANVAILATPLRSIDDPGKRAYVRPGFETEASPLASHDMHVLAPWADGPIHAGPCLAPGIAGGRLAVYESERIQAALDHDLRATFVAKTEALFTDEHFQKHRFRGDSPQQAQVLFDPDSQRMYRVQQAGPAVDVTDQSFKVQELFPRSVLLFRPDMRDVAASLADRLGAEAPDSLDSQGFLATFMVLSLAEREMQRGVMFDPLAGVLAA